MSAFAPWVAALRRDRHLIGYASGNFGKALLLGSLDVTLLFLLTDILGIAPARVGLLMALVFAGDLGFDLAAGQLAARAERRGIGYARLIVLAAPPCALAFGALYALPLLNVERSGAIALLLLLLRGAYACIDVPHNSLLARVSSDSRARGRASGYRTIFSSAAAVAVATAVAPLAQGAAGPAGATRAAVLGALGALLFCAFLVLAARSAQAAGAAGPPPAARTRAVRLLPAPDRLFAAMAALALLTGFAMPMFAKTLLYLCTYVLQAPALAGRVLLVLALSQMAGAALWIALVRRHDKTTLLALGHGVAALGILLFAASGRQQALLLASTVPLGIGLAAVFMLPWGILADIVDFAEFRHRARHETAAFAAVLVLFKAGGAAALGLVGWTLGRLGYVAGAAQPEAVLDGIRALAFGVPLLGSGLAILVLPRLRIGHARHARVIRLNRWRLARYRPATMGRETPDAIKKIS